MAADLERPVVITSSTTDETPPISRVRVGTEAFDRYKLTPSGVYTGEGAAAPQQAQPRGRFTRPLVVANPSIAETVPRVGSPLVNVAPLTTQILYLQAVDLPANLLVTGAGFITGTQAAVTPTNWWYVLLNSARVVKAVTADQLTAAAAASTDIPLPFAATYTTTAAGLYYVGVMFKAATVPSLHGVTTTAAITTPIPILAGASTTGQTTPPAVDSAAQTAITPGTIQVHAYLY